MVFLAKWGFKINETLDDALASALEDYPQAVLWPLFSPPPLVPAFELTSSPRPSEHPRFAARAGHDRDDRVKFRCKFDQICSKFF